MQQATSGTSAAAYKLMEPHFPLELMAGVKHPRNPIRTEMSSYFSGFGLPRALRFGLCQILLESIKLLKFQLILDL